MQNYQGVIHADSHAADNRTSNTISRFTNYLPARFTYDDAEYEVCLSEIQFPNSWYNVPEHQFVACIDAAGIPRFLAEIGVGHYNDIDELIRAVNTKLFLFFASRQKTPTIVSDSNLHSIVYYTNSKKIQFKELPETTGYRIIFSLRLAQIFGFTNNLFIAYYDRDYETSASIDEMRVMTMFPGIMRKRDHHSIFLDSGSNKTAVEYTLVTYEKRFQPARLVGEIPFDITCGFDQVFVYCNLIKPHVMGNKSCQVLRVIPINYSELDRFGQIICRSFDKPQFYELFETSFDRIEIELRDRLGNLIDFKSGTVIATLEIRRKQNNGSFLF